MTPDEDRGAGRRSIWDRLRARIVRSFNRAFRDQNHVFEFDRSAAASAPLRDWSVLRCERLEEVPAAFREGFDAEAGPAGLGSDGGELERHAVLWLARLDGRPAAAMLSRRGEHYRRWLVPIGSADLVLYKARTLPSLRGRGVYPALMREIVARELPAGGRAFVDCKVHNAPSIRGIEKAGFRRVTTVKKTWSPEEELR